MSRILVTYATRYGSTGDVARAVSEPLTDDGFEVDVLHATPGIEVNKYDAVIAGSPSYGRNWLPAAALFVAGNGPALSQVPVAVFTTGMLGVKNPRSALREHERIVAMLCEIAPGLNPVSTALFHGSFDRKSLPFALRVLDWMAGTPQGDHRDWEAIRGWARRVGELFVQALNPAHNADEQPDASDDSEQGT